VKVKHNERKGNKMIDVSKVSKLIGTLKHDDKQVRIRAVEELIQIGKPAIPVLTETLLQDKSSQVRSIAASALGKIGDPTAVPVLEKALRDKSKGVYVNVAKALRKIGTPEAIEAVEKFDMEEINEAMRSIQGKGNLVRVYE